MLWKCSICSLIIKSDKPPEVCTKCGQKAEEYAQLSDVETGKLYSSDRTNDIHAEIISLASRIVALSCEGIEIDLDPSCVTTLTSAKNEAWLIKQRSKAELEDHIRNAKW